MPPLTEEQLQELLDQRFGQPQGIARLNPLAFQFENAFTPYSSAQMDALKTMRLPGTEYPFAYSGTYEDPAFFGDFIKGYDYDPYAGTKKDFNYLYGTRPAFQYDTEFLKPAVKSGIETVDKVQGFVEDDDIEASAIPEFKEGELKQPGGIANFLRAILGFAIPGANLFMGDRSALQGIRSLNQRLRNTDFGRSKNLMDFLDMKKYGGYEGREDARAATMTQARGIQKKIDRGEFGTRDRSIDRGRGSIPSRTTSAPRRSSSSYSAANRAFARGR